MLGKRSPCHSLFLQAQSVLWRSFWIHGHWDPAWVSGWDKYMMLKHAQTSQNADTGGAEPCKGDFFLSCVTSLSLPTSQELAQDLVSCWGCRPKPAVTSKPRPGQLPITQHRCWWLGLSWRSLSQTSSISVRLKVTGSVMEFSQRGC